ncbi:toprim domain-containing protein [Kitasatospora sp. NPDC096147]|uniref:toprim domain-containing protein n=1 Tax=Kitasatospora sp. NPDC096147 TaxID=3364093 RepID=UPI00382047EC
MNARGLGKAASKFGLGYVRSGRTGHEHLTGMLVIPYLRPAGGEHGTATLRFRCIRDECVRDEQGEYLAPTRKERHDGHGKYRSLPGDYPRLFNTPALITGTPHMALSEGEFDAMASEVAGVPCVGSQGTGAWKPHFKPALVGYERVFIIADPDPAGLQAAEKRAADLPNSVVINLGSDINSFVHAKGADAYRKRLGL